MATHCCLFDSKLCIHIPILPLILIFLSLFSKLPWSALSILQHLSRFHQHYLTFPIPRIFCCYAPVAGRGIICQNGSHVALGSFSDAFLGIGGYVLLIFFPVFLLCDVRATGQ